MVVAENRRPTFGSITLSAIRWRREKVRRPTGGQQIRIIEDDEHGSPAVGTISPPAKIPSKFVAHVCSPATIWREREAAIRTVGKRENGAG
jgi:hypothetical protein